MWSHNAPFGYISEGNEITISERYLYAHFPCSIIYNTQDMETTLLPMGGWMDKENMVCVCIYNIYIYGILFSHWKQILPLWQYRWNLKPLSLVKQVRERQILCDLIYMWNLKLKKTNSWIQANHKDGIHQPLSFWRVFQEIPGCVLNQIPGSQANTLRWASSMETGSFPDSFLCAGSEGGWVHAKPLRIISQFAIV